MTRSRCELRPSQGPSKNNPTASSRWPLMFLKIERIFKNVKKLTTNKTAAWSASFTNLLTSKSPSEEPKGRLRRDTFTSITEAHIASPSRDSPHPPQSRTSRPSSRPMSIVQPYQPPLLEVERDTLPELQPIFTFLNSHSKKLYTEGYFLKLNDLNPGMFFPAIGAAG